jgi:hypothetical protein
MSAAAKQALQPTPRRVVEGTPTYVVQASPLSKLFMSEWVAQIEENPALVFEDVPFEVRVPRPFGGLIFQHNKPVHINKILPPNPWRKKNNENNVDDLEATVYWLTGGPDGQRSEETDIYGIVALHVDLDVSSALTDIALLAEQDTEAGQKKAAKTYADMQRDLVTNTKNALDEARALADFRVKRALKITHSNLLKQYDTMRQQGMGVYTPSTAEAVGAFILKQEVDKAGENRRKLFEEMNKIIKEQTIIGS